jgi:L-lactate dehydrogenase complex protein LldG
VSASREAILRAVQRATAGRECARPEAVPAPVRFVDPVRAFEENLALAGGACVRVASRAQLPVALQALRPPEDPARFWCSAELGLSPSTPAVSLSALSGLELCVLAGAPAVAESGAVWVVPKSRQERAAAFLAERLVLVVPAAQVVHELHQAYARIQPAAAPFGCFIAGPSKTADIEQALVIGAHGPRALTVLLVGP